MITFEKFQLDLENIGAIPANKLVGARQELHQATQLIAAAGKYLVPERSDDSHTSMQWDEAGRYLIGESIDKQKGIHVGLDLKYLNLLFINKKSGVTDEFVLAGDTIQSALSWMSDSLINQGIDTTSLSLKLHYQLVEHPISTGEPFKMENPLAYAELDKYFSNAYNILNAITDKIPQTGEVRCWPHHFDIATLITIDEDRSAEQARAIGIGLSPGDDTYSEPYFYITPWPYPDILQIELPHLTTGRWHTEGWVGALLLGSDIEKTTDQSQIVSDFILSGINNCTDLLDDSFNSK